MPSLLPPDHPADLTALSPAKIQFALLAGQERELRERILRAGAGAPALKRQIRRLAQARSIRVKRQRRAQLHLLAMPMQLTFPCRSTICPAEVNLFMPGSALEDRLRQLWHSFMGSDTRAISVLPYAVHLESVLGISPSSVHELAFFGASMFEGARTHAPRLHLANRNALLTGDVSTATYLIMAFASCDGDPSIQEGAWRQRQFDARTLLSSMVALPSRSPSLSLLRPSGFFDAIDAAQQAELDSIVARIAKRGGRSRFDLNKGSDGHVTISCVYALPGVERADRKVWTYDTTWREMPDLCRRRSGLRLTQWKALSDAANERHDDPADGLPH